MTRDELAALLNGREYTEEINEDEEAEAKEAGLVVVFGGSDDLMEFRGAIHDEVGVYDGGEAYLDENGLLENKCDEEECPYFAEKVFNSKRIEALWCAEPGVSWTYKTDIPHATFEIMEDGEVFCRGIVFRLYHPLPF